ncbi:MAG: hypothetical protein ACLGIS_14520 [Actinomycetes bacterium]
MSSRSKRMQALLERQDPAYAAIRTDYGRQLLAEVRRLYREADSQAGPERRKLLGRAAAVHQHLRGVEARA